MNLKRARLFFFDADGTLWDFKYKIKFNRKRTIKEAHLTKSLIPLLKKLDNKKISCKILTYQEGKDKNYLKHKLRIWLNNFNILNFFDEIILSDKYKSKNILKIIKSTGLKKNQCFFIGDRYKWDYLEAKKAGIKCFLLNKKENQIFRVKLFSLKDILNLIED